MLNSIEEREGDSERNVFSASANPTSTLFVPSRIRVAVLDSDANVYGALFNRYRHSVKGYYDFVQDGRACPVVTHGLHVASLLLEMDPDIDLYFGRVLGKDGYLGAKPLTEVSNLLMLMVPRTR